MSKTHNDLVTGSSQPPLGAGVNVETLGLVQAARAVSRALGKGTSTVDKAKTARESFSPQSLGNFTSPDIGWRVNDKGGSNLELYTEEPYCDIWRCKIISSALTIRKFGKEYESVVSLHNSDLVNSFVLYNETNSSSFLGLNTHGNCSLRETTFRSPLSSCNFQGNANFDKTTFAKPFRFINLKNATASFLGARFEDKVKVISEFGAGVVCFKGAEFNGPCDFFHDVIGDGKLELDGAKFNGGPIDVGENGSLDWKNVDLSKYKVVSNITGPYQIKLARGVTLEGEGMRYPQGYSVSSAVSKSTSLTQSSLISQTQELGHTLSVSRSNSLSREATSTESTIPTEETKGSWNRWPIVGPLLGIGSIVVGGVIAAITRKKPQSRPRLEAYRVEEGGHELEGRPGIPIAEESGLGNGANPLGGSSNDLIVEDVDVPDLRDGTTGESVTYNSQRGVISDQVFDDLITQSQAPSGSPSSPAIHNSGTSREVQRS